jgi:biotin carboxyl carrier protein
MTTLPLLAARTLFRRLPPTTCSTTRTYYCTTSTSTRRSISSTCLALQQRTVKLPGLGDSITEGTIVEWTAKVGQAVKEGDVVAMVETDKVTVDIKAEIDGVLVQQFPAV